MNTHLCDCRFFISPQPTLLKAYGYSSSNYMGRIRQPARERDEEWRWEVGLELKRESVCVSSNKQKKKKDGH